MEDFGYQKDDSQNKFSGLAKKIFLVGATLFSIAGFIYITINAYYFVYQDKNSDIEVIKAEEGPIKVLEEEKSSENSMQIDSSIYEDIFGNKGVKKENIRQAIPKIKTAPEPVLPPSNLVQKSLTKESIINKDPKPVKVQDQKIIIFSDAAKKEAPAKDLLTNSDSERNQPKVAPASEKEKKRAVRVQVAAMTSKNAANEHWDKLNHLYPNLFSGLRSYNEEVNLGKRGIFYRLQIGNFYNQIEAEEFCGKYVAQAQKSKADCIVVE
jgi:cell division septation protein DedD